MNEYDRDNFQFLMKADKATLEDWAQHADADDWKYAMELFALANAELDCKIAEQFDDVEDVSDAQEVLRKIALL